MYYAFYWYVKRNGRSQHGSKSTDVMAARLKPVTAVLAALLLLQDPYSLKVDVPVVSVDVTVVDSKGALVNNLTKSDFEIYEDGIAQGVRFFGPISEPYNVFLLFDSSGKIGRAHV